MRYFYKNKNNDFYSSQLINNPLFWIVITFVLVTVTIYFQLKGISLGGLTFEVCSLSMCIFVGLLSYQLYQAKRYLGSFSRTVSYLLNYDLVEALDTAILNSRSAAAMTNKSYRVLPKIWLWYEKNSGVLECHLKIQKLAGSYESDLDHVAELVSSTMGDHFEVISKSIDRSGSWFEIICGLVNENMRFIPKSIADFEVKPHQIKLMNNLVIPMNRLPHLGLFGSTGSQKTTVLLTILAEVIGTFDEKGEASCYFIDGKGEFKPLKTFYPADHFATEPNEVLTLLKRLLAISKRREKIINNAVKSRGVMGLTACDIGLKPIYVFIDEYASVKARFPKPKELETLMLQALMTFRSFGIYILYSSQSPSTQVLSNQMRSQFSTYILLSNANEDTQRMVFDQVVTTGTVPVGSGYYLEKTAKMATPQRFEVPDTHKYKLNTLEVLKEIYEKGRKKNGPCLRRRKIQIKR